MEYYFDPDDKLERNKYAEFLKSMLENCDKYRREDSDGAYVIAIDSPWGTGKTRFAKMLRNYLEDRTKEMGDDSLPGKNAAFNAIYYNSWETDFSDDALLPLVHSILESPEMELKRFDTEGKKTIKKFKKVAIDVAKIAGYTILHNVCGETVTQMAKAAEAAATETEKDPLKRYKERLDLLKNFRSDLQDVIAQTRQKKLVIIIDELDRCRPTFAIQTLELVKHLFAVKGLVFIFALDIKQLSCSVKTIYGQEMDATGYLCRFFDYSVKMPSQDVKIFIGDLLIKADTKSKIEYLYNKGHGTTSRTDFIEFVYDLSEKASLSLRDLTTIFETFHLMMDSFLNQYHSFEAMKLYFLILLIKYKYLDLFKRLFIGKRINEEASGYFKRHLGFELENSLKSKLLLIYDSKDLFSRAFRVTSIVGENLGGGTTISSVSGDANNITIAWNLRNDNTRNTQPVIYRQECCFDGVLYNPDIVKWDQIKNLTLSQYFHQQLEMFNFALPADETAIQS